MIKKILLLSSIIIFSFSLYSMDRQLIDRDPEIKAAVLGNEFEAILNGSFDNSEKANRLLKIKKDLITYRVIESDLLREIIEKYQSPKKHNPFTSNEGVTLYGPEKGYDHEKELLYEQNHEYEETLLQDQVKRFEEKEKRNEDKAVLRLQAAIRGRLGRARFAKNRILMLAEKQEDQDEINRELADIKPLDESIVKLAQAENPETAYNDVADGIQNRGILVRLRKHGLNVAKLLKEANKKIYKTPRDRQTALTQAIVNFLESDKPLATLRANRIVQIFLKSDSVNTNNHDKSMLHEEKKQGNIIGSTQPTTTTSTTATTTTTKSSTTSRLNLGIMTNASIQPINTQNVSQVSQLPVQQPQPEVQQPPMQNFQPIPAIYAPRITWTQWFNDHRTGILTSLSAAIIAGIAIIKLIKR